MNVLIVGCGGIGGYFGARLIEAGTKVTFLTRGKTQQRLQSEGLKLFSARGDVFVSVDAITKASLKQPYDLILLTCKTYDLAQCLKDCEAAVNDKTYILPMLNGFGHYQQIQDAYPKARLLHGYCNVSAARESNGHIRHYNSIHEMTIGIPSAYSEDERVNALIEQLKLANFNLRVSKAIQQELWEKFVFINALAGVTTLLRGTVGDVVATQYGAQTASAIIDECQTVAKAHGYEIRPRSNKITRDACKQKNSPLSASMLKDIQNNHEIELNLISELCNFAEQKSIKLPLMNAVHSQLEVYQNQLR